MHNHLSRATEYVNIHGYSFLPAHFSLDTANPPETVA